MLYGGEGRVAGIKVQTHYVLFMFHQAHCPVKGSWRSLSLIGEQSDVNLRIRKAGLHME